MKILKRVIDVICIIAIVLLGAYAVLRFTNKVIIYEVETGSMENNIHVGDYILIFSSSDYNIGDIITFRKGNGFITHRIVEKNGNSIVTRGDANNVNDEPISISDIVGKVIYRGALLNFVITFKYAIISFILGIYFLTYYFDKKNTEKEKTNLE